MENSKYAAYTTGKLKSTKQSLELLTYMLAGVLLVSVIANLFFFKKSTLTIVPLAMLPIVIINLNNIKQLKKEIATRKDI